MDTGSPKPLSSPVWYLRIGLPIRRHSTSSSRNVRMMCPNANVVGLIDLSVNVLGFPVKERYNISITVMTQDWINNFAGIGTFNLLA